MLLTDQLRSLLAFKSVSMAYFPLLYGTYLMYKFRRISALSDMSNSILLFLLALVLLSCKNSYYINKSLSCISNLRCVGTENQQSYHYHQLFINLVRLLSLVDLYFIFYSVAFSCLISHDKFSLAKNR